VVVGGAPGEPNLVFLRAAALLGRGDTDRGLLRLPATTSIDALIG
jgi:hypothetical protein